MYLQPAGHDALSMPISCLWFPPLESALLQWNPNPCSQTDREALCAAGHSQEAVFKQVLLRGWLHRSLKCTWARQMMEQNAQSTVKAMGAEGITLSLLLVASAQLWSEDGEEIPPISLNGFLLAPRRKCSSRPGKRAAEMKRSDEAQDYQLLLWPLQTEQALTHHLWAPHLVDLTNDSLWFLEGKKNNKTLPLGHATHPTYRYHLSFIW